MPLPPNLSIALKEWATVCDALLSGRQMILLRKGGIYESAGEFELEHRQFVFFPTYLHQNLKMLKPDAQAGFTAHAAEPSRVKLSAAGEVTEIIQLNNRAQMDALDAQHIWTPPLIDMRFNYRPGDPLYLVLVRAYKLPEPIEVENTIAYAGCKSWVPLEQSIDTSSAVPALDDAAYNYRRTTIIETIKRFAS